MASLHMYESEYLLVVAKSAEDAVKAHIEAYGLTGSDLDAYNDGTLPEHFTELPDDAELTCQVMPDGERAECGYSDGATPLTLTYREWCEREGRGLFGDDNAC